MIIDAKNVHYKPLNAQIRKEIENGEKLIELNNINGHRYISCNLQTDAKIIINGVPGNDLGFSMDGPLIEIKGNAQDGLGNTMNEGKIIIHGNAGDICGYAMRGGKIFIKGNVGYRSGIHMKEYKEKYPIIIIGGKAGDYCGEYMAGGLLIVLGLEEYTDGDEVVGYLSGTGMHGGRMFIRGEVEEWKLGKEVKIKELDDDDKKELQELLDEYQKDLGITLDIQISEFKKFYPGSKRPYGNLYAY